jgi:hypothetical protein
MWLNGKHVYDLLNEKMLYLTSVTLVAMEANVIAILDAAIALTN